MGSVVSKHKDSLYAINKKMYLALDTNHTQLAFLTSYGVVGALLKFKRREDIVSEIDIQFQEVKTIHAKLSNIVSRLLEDEPSEMISVELSALVEPELDRLSLHPEKIQTDSTLLTGILPNFNSTKGGSYRERLLKKGYKLNELVEKKGFFYRVRDVLCEDYRSISDAFNANKTIRSRG